MRRKRWWSAGLVLLCVWFNCAQGAAAAPPSLRLLTSVKVSGATVTLADLLPAGVPDDIRDSARVIFLGAAPQPGIQRILTQAELKAMLAQSPLTPPGLILPHQVLIERDVPEVSRNALLAVIQSALKDRSGFDAASLTADQIVLPLPVYAEADAPMVIDAIEQDPHARDLRFRVRFSRQPQRPEFYVLAPVRVNLPILVATRTLRVGDTVQAGDLRAADPHRQADAQKLTGFKVLLGVPAGGTVQRSMLAPAPLVVAGRPVTMLLRGNGYTLTSTVIALQSAAMGQTVRVRNPRTRATAEARVAGPGQVVPVKGAFHELQIFRH